MLSLMVLEGLPAISVDIAFQVANDIPFHIRPYKMTEDFEIRALGREHPYPVDRAEIRYQRELRSIQGSGLLISLDECFIQFRSVPIDLRGRITKSRYVHHEPAAAACIEIEQSDH